MIAFISLANILNALHLFSPFTFVTPAFFKYFLAGHFIFLVYYNFNISFFFVILEASFFISSYFTNILNLIFDFSVISVQILKLPTLVSHHLVTRIFYFSFEVLSFLKPMEIFIYLKLKYKY